MRKASLKRSAGLFIAIVACMAIFGAPAASAAQPDCGDTIKKDVKLTANLNCTASNSNGLVIGANNVTVDLNGHEIKGPTGSYYGIDNSTDYWDGLEVKDGKISGFNYGIYAYYASKVHLSNLKIDMKDEGDYAVYYSYGRGFRANKVNIKRAGYGFYLYDAPELRVTKSKVTENDSTSSYPFYVYYGTGLIDDVEANGGYYGAYLSGNSDGLTLKNGTFNNAGYAGVYVSNSTPLFEYDYTLRNNVANNADVYGLFASYDVKGGGNKAKGAGTRNYYNVPR